MGKVCTKCNIEKDPIKDFYKHKNGKDGLNPVCKVCWKKANKKFEEKNPRKKYRKERYERIKPEYIKKNNKRIKKRYDNDINFRLLKNTRSRINHAIKGHIKSCNTKQLLGIDIKNYKNYLKDLFKEGMSWDNYGEWEIDHIIPCSSFNLLNFEEQKQCFHYINTHPLWKDENREKSSKLDT